MENIINWRFGVVGNIVGEHTDSEGNVYYGTKTFTPGTKVYLDGKYWSEEWDTISVIGRNRFGRIVCDRVDVDIIENVRCQRIYKPQVLEIIHHLDIMEGWDWWGRSVADRKGTEKFVKDWINRKNSNGI